MERLLLESRGVSYALFESERERFSIANVAVTDGDFDMENMNTEYHTLNQNSSQNFLPPKYSANISARPSSPSLPITQNNTGKAYIALLASILFLIILTLEVVASIFASKGRSIVATKQAAWCSPMFQAGLTVQSGCQLYSAVQDPTKGIGCVNLQAHLQSDWLRATEILVPMALILQALDFLVLWSVHGSRRLRGIKMKRPWFTVCFLLFLSFASFLSLHMDSS
jgi:hypothetical protein